MRFLLTFLLLWCLHTATALQSLPASIAVVAGRVVITTRAERGQRCYFVASEDLKSWQVLREFTVSDSEPVELFAEHATNPHRFYRVLTP